MENGDYLSFIGLLKVAVKEKRSRDSQQHSVVYMTLLRLLRVHMLVKLFLLLRRGSNALGGGAQDR